MKGVADQFSNHLASSNRHKLSAARKGVVGGFNSVKCGSAVSNVPSQVGAVLTTDVNNGTFLEIGCVGIRLSPVGTLGII